MNAHAFFGLEDLLRQQGDPRVGSIMSLAKHPHHARKTGFLNPRLLDVPGPSPLVLANKPRA